MRKRKYIYSTYTYLFEKKKKNAPIISGPTQFKPVYRSTSPFLNLKLKGFPGSSSGKEPTCQSRRHKRHRLDPWVRKIPWRRAQQPTLVFLPGESPWTEEPGRLQFMGSQTVRHVGCLLALAGWYKPPTGFCHKPYEITVEPQSRAPHLLRAGHVIHSYKHTVELVKHSRKRVR